jgi:hypothetical protein
LKQVSIDVIAFSSFGSLLEINQSIDYVYQGEEESLEPKEWSYKRWRERKEDLKRKRC